MKTFGQALSVSMLALLITYLGSYVVLRCTGMGFATSGHTVQGRAAITTHVVFGDGNNFGSRAATVVYFPLHRAESAWLHWMRIPTIID